jgi:hypothetical protein
MAETGVNAGAGKGIVAASVAAILSSLATIACCLPMGFLAAAGAAGAGVFFQRFRPWLLGLSVLLLGVGFVQQRRGARCGMKPRPWIIALLWIAAGIVVVVLLFPQEIAGFFADGLGGGAR